MLRRLLSATVLLVCAALPLAGCSGGQTGGGTPTPTANPTTTASPTDVAVSPTTRTSPIPLPTTAQLTVPSAGVAWVLVAGLELFRSTDRGDTWQARPLPVDPAALTGVSFVDDRQGWVLGGPTAAGCQTTAAAIWRTGDAGTSWQRVEASGLADSRCKSELSFVDASHGYLLATDPNGATAAFVYRTTDGGRSWTASAPLPAPAGQVHGFDSTLLLAAGTAVLRSADGGATWGSIATVPSAGGSVAFVTAMRWLMLVAPGQSQETVDAGATWHPYPSDYSQAAPVAPTVLFGSPQVGYATVRGTLQRTVDGGLHWSVIRTPGTTGG
jgi:photosystem II stability/assembly factor-like uncharacterized protein